MRYNKFIIKGFRGISDVTEINISKESIIPIIGKNESGKTTCLEAINAFNFLNDKENGGKQLSNFVNLYSTLATPIIIAAEIEVDKNYDLESSFKEHLDIFKDQYLVEFPEEEFDVLKIDVEVFDYTNTIYVQAYQKLAEEIRNSKPIIIERDLRLKQYSFPLLKELLSNDFLNLLGETFVKALPFILYFDDFRDRMPEKVYITDAGDSALFSNWILFIDELFKQTKNDYSVFHLPETQDSIRRSIIKEVQRNLNKVLTEEWSKYQFENNDDILIQMEYLEGVDGPFLQFKIVEKVLIDNIWEERYFDISDRSKGFYWYFNFMIKLHFNPNKRNSNDIDTIYLLDEPGSYLHTYALNKLAEQLKRLSLTNKVIYCTHSHNLLNPEFIPINSIRIAEKINKGRIILKRVDERELVRTPKNSPYQPILDALEVKPPLFEYGGDNIILLEGIYDFYSFKMFTSSFLAYFPCVSASSIVHQIPYMIFLGKKYLALWDNDSEGRARLVKAKEQFGEMESEKFLLLENINNLQNTKLEEYYEKTELDNFNLNHLGNSKAGFYKSILSLYYAHDRQNLIDKYFLLTKYNFLEMEKQLKLKLESQKTVPFDHDIKNMVLQQNN